MLSNTEAEPYLLENYLHSLFMLSSKYKRRYSKNKQKSEACLYSWDCRFIIMKMKKKIKNRSHRYDINSPKSRYECKYSKYEKCRSMTVLICIKQHLSNI